MLTAKQVKDNGIAFAIGYDAGFAGDRKPNPYRLHSFSHTDYNAGYARGRDDHFEQMRYTHMIEESYDEAFFAEQSADADAETYGRF